MDPKDVRNLVAQYLDEAGLSLTLSAFEEESGPWERPAKRSHLLSILDAHAKAEGLEDHDAALDKRLRREEERVLAAGTVGVILPPADHTHVADHLSAMQKVHSANVIAVTCLFGRGVFSGGADRQVRFTPYSVLDPDATSLTRGLDVHNSRVVLATKTPVLDLRLHQSTKRLLVACMDGTVTIVSVDDANPSDYTFKTIQTVIGGRKFAVRVAWNDDASMFAVASYDQAVQIFGLTEDGSEYALIAKVNYQSAVEGVVFSPKHMEHCPEEAQRKHANKLVVLTRSDHCLHIVDPEALRSQTKGPLSEIASQRADVRLLNMNEIGDDHVSFTAMDATFVRAVRDRPLLLIATDKNRFILYDFLSGHLLRSYYGPPNISDVFSNPRVCLSPTGAYIYGTTTDGPVVVFETDSCRLIRKLTGHTASVRSLAYDDDLDILISGGHDHAVRLWN
eukprot:Clim_evm30s143 gene=Clim_evmTU30s143